MEISADDSSLGSTERELPFLGTRSLAVCVSLRLEEFFATLVLGRIIFRVCSEFMVSEVLALVVFFLFGKILIIHPFSSHDKSCTSSVFVGHAQSPNL